MTLHTYLTHGNEGYRFHLVEVPEWAWVMERSAEWLCDHTGQVLCSAGLPNWCWKVGFKPDLTLDGLPRHSIGTMMFTFGQWFHSLASRRERVVGSIIVTADFVARNFPDQLAEEEEQEIG